MMERRALALWSLKSVIMSTRKSSRWSSFKVLIADTMYWAKIFSSSSAAVKLGMGSKDFSANRVTASATFDIWSMICVSSVRRLRLIAGWLQLDPETDLCRLVTVITGRSSEFGDL
jgi:hypothetical protein